MERGRVEREPAERLGRAERLAQGGAGAGGAAGGGMGGNAGTGGMGGAGGYQPCPMTGDCIILPFGDSITDGYNIAGGYRIELFRSAHADGHAITFVGSQMNGPTMVDGVMFPQRHEGHSGWKIAQLFDLTPTPAFNTKPHIVLLMIGTNDINQNDNLAQAPTRLGTLLDMIVSAAPDALVVVAKLTPMSSNTTQIKTYNDALPGVVSMRAQEGKHVVLIDQNTGFPTSELADGVHPNTQGYARMAAVWYQAIEPLLP